MRLAARTPEPREDGGEMDLVMGLLQVVGMLVALGVILVLAAALFMIVFQIAAGIDDRINN